MKTVEDAIDEQARIDDIEPAEVAASKQQALRAIAAGRTIHLIDTDRLEEAATWYRTSEPFLSDIDRAAIETHLQQTSLQRASHEGVQDPTTALVVENAPRPADASTDGTWLVAGKGGAGLDFSEPSTAEQVAVAGPAAPLPLMGMLQAAQVKGQNRTPSGASPGNPKAAQDKSGPLIPLKRGGKGSIAFGFVARATDPTAAQWLNDHVRRYGFGPTKLKPIVDNFYNNDPSDKHAMSRNAAYIAIALGQQDRKKFDNAFLFGKALANRIGIDADMQKDPPKEFDRTTSAALISARSSIGAIVNAQSTSSAARGILRNWMTGKGRSYLYFGPQSPETRELLSSNKEYYRGLFDFVIGWLANGKYKTGDLRDGYWATSVVHDDFGAIAGMKGLSDGAQMEDIIGTPKYGIDLYVKDGRIYYTMANDMDLSSFAAGNVLGTEVYLPKEGQPFSRIHMVFQWSEPIPPHLRPKK